MGVALALASVHVQVEAGLAHFLAFAGASISIQNEIGWALTGADGGTGSRVNGVTFGRHSVALAFASMLVQLKVGVALLVAVAGAFGNIEVEVGGTSFTTFTSAGVLVELPVGGLAVGVALALASVHVQVEA